MELIGTYPIIFVDIYRISCYLVAMPRSSRIVIEGCAHHVTQRGNNREDVFFVDDDRRVFLMLLADASERYGSGWLLSDDQSRSSGRYA